MIQLLKTTAENQDFQKLVKLLDADLSITDGEDHAFYSQYNKTDAIKYVIVAYDEQHIAVGCGAIKAFDTNAMEVKRMYVATDRRGQGIASELLKALEDWAKELNYTKCVLETGKRQPDAIGLYQKNGYQVTPNYGQYIGVENSVCFEKLL